MFLEAHHELDKQGAGDGGQENEQAGKRARSEMVRVQDLELVRRSGSSSKQKRMILLFLQYLLTLRCSL